MTHKLAVLHRRPAACPAHRCGCRAAGSCLACAARLMAAGCGVGCPGAAVAAGAASPLLQLTEGRCTNWAADRSLSVLALRRASWAPSGRGGHPRPCQPIGQATFCSWIIEHGRCPRQEPLPTSTNPMLAAAALQPTLAAPAQRGQQQGAALAPQRAAGWSSRASPALRGGAAAAAALAARPAPRAAVARAAQQIVAAAAVAPGSAGSVAIAGATGLIGTVLVRQLQAQGYTVRVLARNPVAARGKLPYPGVQFVAPAQWAEAVCGCTAVVNLAGEWWVVWEGRTA